MFETITNERLAFPEGRLSGDGVAGLRFPECLLDGLLAAAPGPLACPSRSAWPRNCLDLT